MASSRRPRPLSVVLFTIATTLVLLGVTPRAASHDVSGPLIDVEFTDVWTNDDGSPDAGDAGDTGQVSPLYDAWNVSPLSSSDPRGPGFGALREDKDVAICTGRVSPSDPGIVEVSIANGYPAYVCTLNTVIYNGSGLPITVALAVIEADPGLAVQAGAVQPPVSLGPGGQAEAMFSVGVLNTALQSTTLHAVITIAVTAEPHPRSHHRGQGDQPRRRSAGIQLHLQLRTGLQPERRECAQRLGPAGPGRLLGGRGVASARWVVARRRRSVRTGRLRRPSTWGPGRR